MLRGYALDCLRASSDQLRNTGFSATTHNEQPIWHLHHPRPDLCDFGFGVANDVALVQNAVVPHDLLHPLNVCPQGLVAHDQDIVLGQGSSQSLALSWWTLVSQRLQDIFADKLGHFKGPVAYKDLRTDDEGRLAGSVGTGSGFDM